MPRKNKKGRRGIKFLGIVNSKTRSTLKWKTYQRAEEQEWRCYYCNCKMIKHVRGQKVDNEVTADHRLAQAKGGTNLIENIVAACNKCNQLKKVMDEHVFIEFLKKNNMIHQLVITGDKGEEER